LWAAPDEQATDASAPASAQVAVSTQAAAAPVAQESPAPKARPRLSAQITNQVLAFVPAWQPTPEDKKADAAKNQQADANTVKMAPVVVRGLRLPRSNDRPWLTPEAIKAATAREYLSSFDRTVLNRYALPGIGITPEARAQMMYLEEKRLRDLKWINDQIEELKKSDPAAAKELAEIRDTTFTRSGW